VEIAAIIQIAQTGRIAAYIEDKHAARGKHRLKGPDMTVDEPLAILPVTAGQQLGKMAVTT
jgi:hypothetical protein